QGGLHHKQQKLHVQNLPGPPARLQQRHGCRPLQQGGGRSRLEPNARLLRGKFGRAAEGGVSQRTRQLRARARRALFLGASASISAGAVRRRRPSRPRGPTSWAPSGRPPSPANSGNDTAGKPLNVHKVQNAGSPVEPSPSGATPGAAGVTIAS